MTALIELGNNDRLYIKAEQHMLSLYPGVGGAHVSLRFDVSRQNDAPNGSPFQVSALVYVCRTSGQDQKLLGVMEARHSINPQVRSSQFELVGFVSDEQLRVIEELRRGEEVHLNAAFTVTSVEGDPSMLQVRTGYGSFHIGGGEWSKQMEQVNAGGVVEVLVPMVGGADYAAAWNELREARTLLRNNEIKGALVAARSTLELVRKSQRTNAVVRAVKKREAESPEPRPEEQRSLTERFAFTLEALYANLSGAMHRPSGAAKTFEYTRADAAMLVAAVAGMLARLSEERRLT
ncbi:hypothetical protein ACNAW0_00230 [Micromonospora sp. SL1-18]|uniref:hypothetical protein n=1 Tax=Micromonospora sp. SL1-18 TaxID=3399128 RepID=UPI003A4D62BC